MTNRPTEQPWEGSLQAIQQDLNRTKDAADMTGWMLRDEIVQFLCGIRVILSLPTTVSRTDQQSQLPHLVSALERCNTALSNMLYMDDKSIPDSVIYRLVALSTQTSLKAKRLLKQLHIRANAMTGEAANLRAKAPILLRKFRHRL
ncbi:MAG: hypothetical protein WC353_00125 [Candidatus Peribacter sp.]|jgi:hypothetical protein